MTIEVIIGLVVIIAVIAALALRKNKEEPLVDVTPPSLNDSQSEWPFPTSRPEETEVAEKKPAKKTTAKKTTKKAAKVDLDSMNKTELLAYAKANGVKANASLKKEEILDRIKNG